MPAARRSTVYLDRALHRALKMKSAATEVPVSELINRAVKLALAEDAIDLAAFSERAKEPSRTFEAVLKDLKRDGLL
jgi:hypothetical protein